MRQVAGLISTYSSDEFGICSALFELGGMVVMHDASGCNSTYTTHDEPRWYEMDSMVYISAISEAEAIMGDDDKFIRDLVETAGELHPAFIALVGAPIPYMIGTDLDAIAMIVEQETGIPCFGFQANGMHDYTVGVSMAMKRMVEAFAGERLAGAAGKELSAGAADGEAFAGNAEVSGGNAADGVDLRQIGQRNQRTGQTAVNIIGATPLDFSVNGSIASIRQWITDNDMIPGVCLSMGCGIEELKKLKDADVNLVVSGGGLAAARVLEERFGTPYVTGVPFGETFSVRLAAMLKQAAAARVSYSDFREPLSQAAEEKGGEVLSDCTDGCRESLSRSAEEKDSELRTTGNRDEIRAVIIGESVFCTSLAAAIELDAGIPVRVLCPLEEEDGLLRPGDRKTPEEDDLSREIGKADVVIGDPLYRSLTEGQRFYDLPHEAFSGRIYDRVNPNLIAKKIEKGNRILK